MFKQVIRSTQLTTDAANSFFQHINGDSFQQDVSFISTLRALVAPRMKEGESITLSFFQSNYSASHLGNFSARNAVRDVCDLDYCDPGRIIIHNFNHTSQDSNFAWMELMKSTFTSVYTDWHRLEKVTEFFKKRFYALCFINPEKKSVVVFADSLDIRNMHYLQCSIFAFLPWYFDPKLGVSQVEMDLIESLRDKQSSAAYEDCIAKIAEQYDFKTAKIKQLLAGFETRYEQHECENVRQQIQNCITYIDDLSRQIGDYLKAKNDYEIKLLGLETKIASNSGESEIMGYFLRNNRLSLESVTNNTMVFVVKTYLEFFDEDSAARAIRNDTSYVYRPNGRGCNRLIPAEDMKMLMTAIFVDQTIRMRVCAAYQFDIVNGRVSGIGSYEYGSEFREYTPNTHIDGFRCIGSYQKHIVEFLKHHDYIGAIEQCAASCRSLNFSDPPVMGEFMRRMYGISERQDRINMRCLELPDGSVVTPVEAIEWLKNQEQEANE